MILRLIARFTMCGVDSHLDRVLPPVVNQRNCHAGQVDAIDR